MKEKNVTIFCKNTKSYHDFPIGTSLLEIFKSLKIELPYGVVAARVNYKVEALNFLICKPKDIEFIDASCSSGMRVYIRTLSMILAKAVYELYPNATLHIAHSISRGFYCTLENFTPTLDQNIVSDIKQKMEEIIAADETIQCIEKQYDEVKNLFRNASNCTNKDMLFDSIGRPYVRFYKMGEYIDYYSSVLLPSTGYVDRFDLISFESGMLLRVPNKSNPELLAPMIDQPKMFEIFTEYIHWNEIIGLKNVGEFNKACKESKTYNSIKIAEALHEKKIAEIADLISANPDIKIVLISGPSSSGKTTFSKRLSVQMMVNGMVPKNLSLDNYFVDRVNTPKDENGEYDFESLYALDLEYFHRQMAELIAGKEVELPTFNFSSGKRIFKDDKLQLEKNSILMIEGIHALNPELTRNIPSKNIFKIYVSALTTISIDEHNWISTTDVRLLRRIIRDYKFRGYSAIETIARWESVRRGEDKWIFPYQENADVMFNSALIFELAVIKKYVEPILRQVPKYCNEYTETHRLIKFLRYFVEIPDSEIPPTSLLREFLGGSSFNY